MTIRPDRSDSIDQPRPKIGKGQHSQIGYSATAVVFNFCTFTTEIFFMEVSPWMVDVRWVNGTRIHDADGGERRLVAEVS